MFKFDFDLEEDEQDDSVVRASSSKSPRLDSPQRTNGRVEEVCHDISLDELLAQLPSTISYSPLHLPFLDKPLLRRDLYDARFQLAASFQPTDHDRQAEDEYIDAKTDLIKGVYEGGLKTWEGGVDLVEVLSGLKDAAEWCRGSRVVEAGCGTALPTAFLLESLLAAPSSASLDSAKTVLHLQDFNLPVLALVTLPNLLLAALHHVPVEALRPAANTPDVEETLPDDEVEGILTITPALKAAFIQLLEERGVEMRFSYGHWGALAQRIEQEGKRYGLVLTAETIYEESSVPSLLWLLKASSSTPGQPGNAPRRLDVAAGADELETGVGALSVSRQWASTTLRDQPNAVILVAAKVLYFGVGGDLPTFLAAVSASGGWHEPVKEWTRGVGRKVVCIGWT